LELHSFLDILTGIMAYRQALMNLTETGDNLLKADSDNHKVSLAKSELRKSLVVLKDKGISCADSANQIAEQALEQGGQQGLDG